MNTYQGFDNWIDGRNEAFAPLFGFGKITAETAESIARRNYDLASDYFNLALSQLKAFSAGNDVAQLGAEETRLANEFGNKLKTHADAYVRIAADASEAYAVWTASLVDSAKQAVAPKSAAAKPAPAKKR